MELGRQIVRHGVDNLDTAVKAYETDMFPRAMKAFGKGKWFAQNFFGAEDAQSFLRAASG